MEEIWKVYMDNRGKGRAKNGALWEVSNLGRVKRNGVLYECKLRSSSGYLGAASHYVHKMVAELFIHNSDPKHKTQVDHIDTNKLNNKVDNLRWCTRAENMRNPITKHNLSKSHKDKYHSEETKHKMSDAHKDKYHSKETKRKMSDAHKGKKYKPMSDEGRHNISESLKSKPTHAKGRHWLIDPETGKRKYY